MSHDISVVRCISHSIAVMYLGKIVEKVPADELMENPLHPYSKALASAIPLIDAEWSPIPLRGEIQRAIGKLKGCVFKDRCPNVMPICLEESPELREVSSNHWVRCFLYT